MNIYEFPPIELLVNAAYSVVTWLSTLLEPLAGSASAALAIVVLTITVRAVLIPVGLSQVRAGITRKRLAPKIAELQTRHKKNPELKQQKIMELYKEEKASPMAGCLPVLAQMPVLMAVYGIFIQTTIGGHANELLNHSLLSIPLNAGFVGLLGGGDLTVATIAVFAVIVVVITVVAALSRHLLTPDMPQTPPVQASDTDGPAMPDLTGVTRVLSFMPFMTAVIALFVPLAATLYLMTTTAWTLAERLVLNRVLKVHEQDEAQRETQSSPAA
ncbi:MULTISPECIES: YidC/Oxa1 family membrane protein insertase [Brevibacterium]|uniref:Membrane protein insertase YidC n=1 Tax=Brevibacterium antiquum CNRZ 918 TaxID=1255637 RepID=A0A2H1IXF2_9MICO|nr:MULTISPECIES: YidC/Oxa1 family membrane protein insertase [Brevibacterium]SMX79818.1 YidC/Oxa1 family membrane protein insertase [Brevibacterium antiquum CNRZ 918]HCG56458.1 membrane protein insertase YidC [Brevibacterium sp.]